MKMVIFHSCVSLPAGAIPLSGQPLVVGIGTQVTSHLSLQWPNRNSAPTIGPLGPGDLVVLDLMPCQRALPQGQTPEFGSPGNEAVTHRVIAPRGPFSGIHLAIHLHRGHEKRCPNKNGFLSATQKCKKNMGRLPSSGYEVWVISPRFSVPI